MNMICQKILCCLLLCFVTLSQGYAQRYDTIRYAREHYAKRVARFQQEPVRKGRIVFLGNSITEFGDWKKLLNDSTVINRGIAADNTFGVLDRLDDVMALQPCKLFIEIGINDIAQNIPVDVILKNISTIVVRAKKGSPATQVYVHGIFPTNDNAKHEYPEVFNKNILVDSFNKRLRNEARANGFTYVDLATLLKDDGGKLDVKYADPDGLHLNEQGYALWVKLLKNKGYL